MTTDAEVERGVLADNYRRDLGKKLVADADNLDTGDAQVGAEVERGPRLPAR